MGALRRRRGAQHFAGEPGAGAVLQHLRRDAGATAIIILRMRSSLLCPTNMRCHAARTNYCRVTSGAAASRYASSPRESLAHSHNFHVMLSWAGTFGETVIFS